MLLGGLTASGACAASSQCGRHVRADMLCPARCSCFLCRELQSCRAADARKPNKNMCDNFILKKAEAWEPMKFIRGAARLSVRHWQSRDPITSNKTRVATHKSTSCEQLYPHPSEDDSGPFGMRRAPSTDRVKPQSEHKALFKLLGNSRNKKISNSDASESKVSVPTEHIYSEPRPTIRSPQSQFDECCRPPVYQSVEKRKEELSKCSADKKIYSNRLPCYEELAQRLSQDKSKKSNLPPPEGGLANKITQNNNKVVIYFGDSIIRKHNEQKKEEYRVKDDSAKEEVIYANRLLEETGNLGLSRDVDKGGGGDTRMVSEVQVPEAIYSEIKGDICADTQDVVTINDATYKKDVFGTMSSDGFLVVEFEGNYERARQLVELVHGGGVDHHEATVLDEDEHCDWSFIQDWRKRCGLRAASIVKYRKQAR
ncbi:hypothetical protein HW555_002438 [Spodoptera exigua]|uniref:Uncharacterized protein n=1 Tax=Spodoptera exigua TaxID=7107 RepID=A0A835GMB5_SPOEX|nr:hypothetical protein HW555_002438 [Spodoptera exigua]